MDVLAPLEDIISQLRPIVLAVPGIFLVAAGLVYWLGGLRMTRMLAAFTAAGVGFICAWLFTDRSLTAMLMLAVIPALIGLFLDKPVVVLIGAMLAGGVVLAYPLFADEAFRQTVADDITISPAPETADLLGINEAVNRFSEWLGQTRQAFWQTLSDGRKLAAAGAFLGVLLVGAAAWRWVCALTCSALGTLLLLAGMGILILSKSQWDQTMAYIDGKEVWLAPAAGAMVVVGAMINRWLCPLRPKPIKAEPLQTGKGDEK